jgi:hypothetical protein
VGTLVAVGPYAKLRGLMTKMHELLVKHDEPQQRIPLAVIQAIDAGDHDKVAHLLNWGGFWGGAGSVDDLVLEKIPWAPRVDNIDQPDNEKFKHLIAALRGEMVTLGIHR